MPSRPARAARLSAAASSPPSHLTCIAREIAPARRRPDVWCSPTAIRTTCPCSAARHRTPSWAGGSHASSKVLDRGPGSAPADANGSAGPSGPRPDRPARGLYQARFATARPQAIAASATRPGADSASLPGPSGSPAAIDRLTALVPNGPVVSPYVNTGSRSPLDAVVPGVQVSVSSSATVAQHPAGQRGSTTDTAASQGLAVKNRRLPTPAPPERRPRRTTARRRRDGLVEAASGGSQLRSFSHRHRTRPRGMNTPA